MPLEQALVEGMGRFPVAGIASYSDDWHAPRYKPTFHRHEGLDIIADFGTPVRAPTAGVVTKLGDAYPGGISVTMRSHDATFWFGHLQSVAPGLVVGQSVEVGTVLGSVGNSGNAAGGVPHVHMEIEREGVNVPPKPFVDGWLDEAETTAGDWVERKRVEIEVARRDGGTDEVATQLLHLALDPARAVLTLLPQVTVDERGALQVQAPVQMAPSDYP